MVFFWLIVFLDEVVCGVVDVFVEVGIFGGVVYDGFVVLCV